MAQWSVESVLCEGRKLWHNSGDRECACDDLVESREHEHDSGDRECDGDCLVRQAPPDTRQCVKVSGRMSIILVIRNVMVTRSWRTEIMIIILETGNVMVTVL